MDYSSTLLTSYLASCIPLSVDEGALQAILFDRGILVDAKVSDVSMKVRELCKADVLMWCSNAPSIMGSVADADGNWSHREGGTQMTDAERKSLLSQAGRIYRKYGEAMRMGSRMKVHNAGFRLW